MNPRLSHLSPLAVLLVSSSLLIAEVKLASPFGSHMVLQRDKVVPVWGLAEPKEIVTVSFAEQTQQTQAGANGRWRLNLEPLAASAVSRTFTVSGSATTKPISLEDVVVGDVWLCGGQSNMERQLGLRGGQKPIDNWEKEVAEAKHPLIRQLYVTQSRSLTVESECKTSWTVCSPETAADFSAVGYFFARDLHEAVKVPIGIIHSSWGGTLAEAWTSAEGLSTLPEFKEAVEEVKDASKNPEKARASVVTRRNQWFTECDPGSGAKPWYAAELDTKDWETMTLPCFWEKAGHPDFDGVVWFRKSFDLPADWKGGDIELHLSSIDDSDTTWVNGTQVGSGELWNKPRNYRVPGALLKSKGNVIAVRVLDTGGNGGIWNPELPFEIRSTGNTFAPIPLAGPWLCRFSTFLWTAPHIPSDVTQGPNTPTVLFNAMIAPLVPYALRGAAFYQGEANSGQPVLYRRLLPTLIADWRRLWCEGDFPFLFVQIAPFKDQPPEIREAQLLAWKATRNAAMIVTIDHGDAEDIHPTQKQPVGARLALAARALSYGEVIEYSGPVFESFSIERYEVVLRFSHLGGGLVAKGGELTGFTIAGKDGKFVPAYAQIIGDTVVLRAPVLTPVAVRYGWANVASGNLFNKAGLPASPFRTDDLIPLSETK